MRADGGFANGVAPTQEAEHHDQKAANLDVHLLSVERVERSVLKIGIGEDAVPEKSESRSIDHEVEGLPEAASELQTKIGSDDHDGDAIERDRTDRIFERLAGRVNRINYIDDPEASRGRKEKNNGMKERNPEHGVAGPIVDPKNVETPMRPISPRAISHGDQEANCQIRSDEADSNKPNIRRKVDCVHASSKLHTLPPVYPSG